MALDRKKRPRDRMRMRMRKCMRNKGGPGDRRRSEVGVCESEAVDEGVCICASVCGIGSKYARTCVEERVQKEKKVRGQKRDEVRAGLMCKKEKRTEQGKRILYAFLQASWCESLDIPIINFRQEEKH